MSFLADENAAATAIYKALQKVSLGCKKDFCKNLCSKNSFSHYKNFSRMQRHGCCTIWLLSIGE